MAKIITYKNEPDQIFSELGFSNEDRVLISCSQENIKIFKLSKDGTTKDLLRIFQINEAVDIFMSEQDWGGSILKKIVDWALKYNSVEELLSGLKNLSNPIIDSDKKTLSVTELKNQFINLAVYAFLALIPILIYSIVQLIRFGWSGNYLFLLFGSLLSFVGLIMYITNELINGIKKKKSFTAMFLVTGCLFPWFLGTYLVINNLWALKGLVNEFSILILLRSLIFIVLGYIIVKKTYQITEIGRLMSDGSLIIENES